MDGSIPKNWLSPFVQAVIAGMLLLMFAGVLFAPGIWPSFKVDADTKQTLFNLVTAVTFFFIGKNTDSANREAAITAAAIAPVPASSDRSQVMVAPDATLTVTTPPTQPPSPNSARVQASFPPPAA